MIKATRAVIKDWVVDVLWYCLECEFHFLENVL